MSEVEVWGGADDGAVLRVPDGVHTLRVPRPVVQSFDLDEGDLTCSTLEVDEFPIYRRRSDGRLVMPVVRPNDESPAQPEG